MDDSQDSTKKEDNPASSETGTTEPPEPGLGPACLVITILGLATMCSVCAFGSWFMFSDQYPLAAQSIQRQLIPWVERCQLAETDKEAVITKLEGLIPTLEAKAIDKVQLTRLHNCLQDNPILLWGAVQSIIENAPEAGLTESELPTLKRVSQRLLNAAVQRKLSRNDLEFAIESCAQVSEDGGNLVVLPPLTADQIRDYMTRAEQLVEQKEIPNEPYDKTAGEAFGILIDAALTVE